MKKIYETEAMVQDQILNAAQKSENTGIETFGLDLLTESVGFDAKEYPEQALFGFLCNRKKMSKKDVLEATGLTRGQYEKVFHNHDDRWRGLNFNADANKAMSKLLDSDDLAPHQIVISELLWKLMKELSMQEILNQLWIMTGRFIEEEYPQDGDFGMSNYHITPEELNEAICLLYLHVNESRNKDVETC